MFGWRVTRYDPALRGEHGSYPETWTSVADVGKTFRGIKLLASEYDRIESLYVAAVLRFAEAFSLERLQVEEYELVDLTEQTLERAEVEPRERPRRAIDLHEAAEVVRSSLRERTSCRLVGDDGHFEVHFGYDLYMYVLGREERTAVAEWAATEDIYIERDVLSPWLPEDTA